VGDFVGEEHGVSVSFFMVNAPPERGPALRRHNYDEIIIVEEGSATCVAGDKHEVKAGDIIVIPAATPHRFVNSGNAPLRQIDIHAQPTFVTEWLDENAKNRVAD
jgi:mannose-6-phosphate isomerase-like protein (cupin superfamily)